MKQPELVYETKLQMEGSLLKGDLSDLPHETAMAMSEANGKFKLPHGTTYVSVSVVVTAHFEEVTLESMGLAAA